MPSSISIEVGRSAFSCWKDRLPLSAVCFHNRFGKLMPGRSKHSLCQYSRVPKSRSHTVQSQRDGPMSAQAIGLGHGTNPMNPKPQRGGPHSDTINRLEDARASNVVPPRWGFVGWSRPSPRPMAWAGIGLPRCGGRQTAVGWPRFKEPGCRRHRKIGSRTDSKASIAMGLVINSRFTMLRTQLA